MRNSKYALYRGREYEAAGGRDNMICLYSYNDDDTKDGFTLSRAGHYYKIVHKSEIDEYYDITAIVKYMDHEFGIVRQEGDMLLLYNIGGNGPLYSQLGFKQVNKGEWEGWVNIKDIQNIWEERRDIPLTK